LIKIERDVSVKKLKYYACKEDDRIYNDREKVPEGGEWMIKIIWKKNMRKVYEEEERGNVTIFVV